MKDPSLKDVIAFAEEVLGGPENAQEWFRSRGGDLGNRSPAEVMKTDEGIKEVYAMLDRIADGVIF